MRSPGIRTWKQWKVWPPSHQQTWVTWAGREKQSRLEEAQGRSSRVSAGRAQSRREDWGQGILGSFVDCRTHSGRISGVSGQVDGFGERKSRPNGQDDSVTEDEVGLGGWGVGGLTLNLLNDENKIAEHVDMGR